MNTLNTPPLPGVVVRAQNVSKRHGSTEAIADMTLHVRSGEIVALLGPSGCGKSTFLASIAGLVRIDGGTIDLGGRPVSGPGLHVAPQDRRVGLVFQDHALFPHKTVAENVGFGLHAMGRTDRRSRTAQMLELVQLTDKGQRYPHELSGGESQRVALARALAPSPDVLLLDEPFASLDPTLRSEVRDEVRALLRSVGTAAVMVSHDIEDALALGDRLAVLRAGRIVQIDAPDVIHRCPVDEHVARIFGPVTALAVTGPEEAPVTVLGPVAPGAVLAWASGRVALVRPHGVDVSAGPSSPGGGVVGAVGAVGVVRSPGGGVVGAVGTVGVVGSPGGGVVGAVGAVGAVGTVRDRQFVGHGSRLVIVLEDGVEIVADVASDAPYGGGERVVVRHRATPPPADG